MKKRFLLICPFGYQTGGPEAIHQLGEALREAEQDVSIIYFKQNEHYSIGTALNSISAGTVLDLGDRSSGVCEDFIKYRVPICRFLSVDLQYVVIIPEGHMEWIDVFKRSVQVLWWLSVDHAFQKIPYTLLNHLRTKIHIHAYQSKYASRFLQLMRFTPAIPLSDYTQIEDQDMIMPVEEKGISISGLPKVVFNVDSIASRLERRFNCEVKVIRGMSQRTTFECLRRSCLYIDLGSFPGKDRLPREAVIRGNHVLLLDVGAVASDDFLVPNTHRVPVCGIESIDSFVEYAFNYYRVNESLFHRFRRQVQLERMKLKSEIDQLIHSLSYIERYKAS
jgi:hypothetical protein